MKHLVLFGGGPAHLHLLRALATSPLPTNHSVTLVSPSPRHVHMPLLPSWVAGERPLDRITVELAPWAAKAGAHFFQADVVQLDPEQRELILSNGQALRYDALSLNGDATIDRHAIPGAREHALFARPVEQFILLWDVLVKLSEEQVLSVVVVGGHAPAIELALAVQKRLGRRVRVALVTGGGSPLPLQPEAVQRRVKQALKRGQVTLFEDRCDAMATRQMQLGQEGLKLGCDAPLLFLDLSPPLWVLQSGLQLDASGFVETSSTLQSLSHPTVFAAGELASHPDAAGWRLGADPKTSATLALNLRRFLAGGELTPRQPRKRRTTWAAKAMGTTGGAALASMGPFLAEARWVGWLKSRIDQKFVRSYRLPPQQVQASQSELDTRPAEEYSTLDGAVDSTSRPTHEKEMSGASH